MDLISGYRKLCVHGLVGCESSISLFTPSLTISRRPWSTGLPETLTAFRYCDAHRFSVRSVDDGSVGMSKNHNLKCHTGSLPVGRCKNVEYHKSSCSDIEMPRAILFIIPGHGDRYALFQEFITVSVITVRGSKHTHTLPHRYSEFSRTVRFAS